MYKNVASREISLKGIGGTIEKNKTVWVLSVVLLFRTIRILVIVSIVILVSLKSKQFSSNILAYVRV